MNSVLSEKKTITDDNVSQYMEDIRRYPMLTQQEELEVAKCCAQGDEAAIRRLVNSNLRLVVAIAREYAGQGIPLPDLIQEGSIGLLTAAKKFDYTMQCRFSTYATKWIRQGIVRYILTHEGVIRVPRSAAEWLRKLRNERRLLIQKLDREPTDEELARQVGITEEKLQQLQMLMPQVCSLDAPTGDSESNLQQMLEDLQAPEPEQELVRRELKTMLETMLQTLPKRQQTVLQMHFGLGDTQRYSLEQIAKYLELSKERVRQIEGQALEKMLKMSTGMGLEDFLK